MPNSSKANSGSPENRDSPAAGEAQDAAGETAGKINDSWIVGAVLIASLGCALTALFLFIWLAGEVLEGDTRNFDNYIRLAVHQHASPLMTLAMSWITELGSTVPLAFLFAGAILIFLRKQWKRAAAWLTVAMAGAVILVVLLKYFLHRTRPEVFFGILPGSYSFPSGHALGSFCFYLVVAGLLAARVQNKIAKAGIWIAAAVLVALIGFSRVYLGVHYPTDVLAGYIAGAIWVPTLVYLDRRRLRRKPR